MCSDGILLELVDFKDHNEGPDELAEEELNQWTGPPASKSSVNAGFCPAAVSAL